MIPALSLFICIHKDSEVKTMLRKEELMEKNKIIYNENLSEMSDEEYQTLIYDMSLEELRSTLIELKEKHSIYWRDRIALSMVKKMPLSFWASDSNFVIKLWEGDSTKTYGYPKVGDCFLDFVKPVEHVTACQDCVEIISNEDEDYIINHYKNHYSVDTTATGQDICVITNCFRVYDDLHDEYLQAEVSAQVIIETMIQKYEERKAKDAENISQFGNQCRESIKFINNKCKELRLKTMDLLVGNSASQEYIKELRNYENEVKKTIYQYMKVGDFSKKELIDEITENVELFLKIKTKEIEVNHSIVIQKTKQIIDPIREDLIFYFDDLIGRHNSAMRIILNENSINPDRKEEIKKLKVQIIEWNNNWKNDLDISLAQNKIERPDELKAKLEQQYNDFRTLIGEVS